MAKDKVTTEATESVYTKAQILASKKYSNRQDILNALLVDGKSYPLSEVDALIEKFMKGKVR